MMPSGNTQGVGGGRTNVVHWQGHSGHRYGLQPRAIDKFAMEEAELYLIAKGSHVLWVGSTQDLVADPVSRSRFRLALDCATNVFSLAAPEDRLATIWDLERAAPAATPVAQAA